ncbi:UDP-N-acetylglucosamine 1-carboxyvinyltransferase [Fructilactobacillus myrtifloralis]|uniref:UDP-N-acetylglucosamine 1-carboxyvinyltransferase n=1 Tax=Fructilactobacillus myrtifloralis TaxID=2940301 RepID=A0ABY5BN03_9LACO|nr:UDP-N-acetylglucosamine 1-carboxyvinyltransferase [Fructilactobacillus myrtifloralis]USS84874.1 UDP-N-acetylglucosamine 1-carboxyvinyltransferase [Fructilactobacillus myrtifloralis]
MSIMKIHGGRSLHGEVTIGGAKNSVVALIPAAVLADSPVKFDMVPDILDVHNLMLILQSMNVSSYFADGVLQIDPTKIQTGHLPSKAIKKLRASYYFMGALLGKFHRAVISFPGGDNIGPRPIDQHIRAFEALGAHVTESGDTVYIDATENGLIGAPIFFEMVSVGATINAILAATRARGITTIHNVAREPEIVDIVAFLNEMGAHITGAGTDVIRIEGVDHLEAKQTHMVIPDRIEAGTYLSLAAAAGDGILIKNVIPQHLEPFTQKLQEMGVDLTINDHDIYVKKPHQLRGVQIKTAPFPAFATDWQQPITPLLLTAQSESVITDTIYPQRQKHVGQLQKMGAQIRVNEQSQIVIDPTPHLHGAVVAAGEIRAGAALMIAGLMADGETVIEETDNILRGYDNIARKLTDLHADVEVLPSSD